MVAHTKGETAALLREVRPLDGRIGRSKPFSRLCVMRLRLDPLAGIPQQPAELAKNPCFADAICCGAVPLQRTLIVLLSRVATAGRATEIRDPLVQDQPLRIAFAAGQQHGEGLLVETDGIVVGVGCTCAIAGGAQIARALRLARAEAEVMSEQDEVFEPFGLAAIEPLQRAANPTMQIDPPLQKQVLIDHIL